MKPEKDVPGMSTFLDSLKYADGLVAVIVQVRDGAGSAWRLHRVDAKLRGREKGPSNAAEMRPRLA